MVTKCANPACGTSFHYLRGGKLFLLDSRDSGAVGKNARAAVKKSATVEYFWLCEKCSVEFTVAVDRYGRAGVAQAHAAVGDTPQTAAALPTAS